MVGVLNSLKSYIHFGKVCIDNNVFRMHYRCTVVLLLFFTIIVTTKQFFGEPIYCMGDGDKYREAINNFCWITSTYTVKRHFKGHVGKDKAHYGVGNSFKGDEEIHHYYYQWVCLILPLQAVLFYIPHALWKMWESGRIKSLTEKLNTPITTNWSKERSENLAKYLINVNLYTHNFYAIQFAFCEFLNLLNVVLQILFLDKFLGGMFHSYGAMVIAYQSNSTMYNEIASPMDQVFPKVTKCLFTNYGSSGSLQYYDLLCILPLNIFHEKIFIFLWFWLIILAFISGIAFLYRLIVLLCPCLRAYSIIVQAKLVPKYHIFNIVHKFRVGDWFLLNQIGKNVDIFFYKELVTLLGEEIDKRKKVEYV